MTIHSFYTRQMLLRYSRQLVAARRLARYDRLLGRAAQADPDVAAVKRQTMVERVAREIVEDLVLSGSDNPIVHEVKERLIKELGEELLFSYPPEDLDIRIFRRSEDGGQVELAPGEKQAVMGRLWDVTLRTVDATML